MLGIASGIAASMSISGGDRWRNRRRNIAMAAARRRRRIGGGGSWRKSGSIAWRKSAAAYSGSVGVVALGVASARRSAARVSKIGAGGTFMRNGRGAQHRHKRVAPTNSGATPLSAKSRGALARGGACGMAKRKWRRKKA